MGSKTKTFNPGDGGPPYRCGVMALVFNRQGQLLACRRAPEKDSIRSENSWQTPQGGIDEGEDPLTAAFRELSEEIGLGSDKVKLLMQAPTPTQYQFPDFGTSTDIIHMKYRGQRHEWFAFLYTGNDIQADVSFDRGDEIEFCAVEWWPPERLVKEVVPFKQASFQTAIAAFADIIAELKKANIATPISTSSTPKP